MTLTKSETIDKIEVTSNGVIQVRLVTEVLEGNDVISKAYHRYSLSPGDSLVNQDSRVSAVAAAVWTPDILSAYQAALLSVGS
jgi:hypothetical protein